MKQYSVYMKRICLFLGLIVILTSGFAQQITVPYICSFEDPQENAQWRLNYSTPNAKDKWVIGDATRSEGANSLYISANNGSTPNYGNTQNVVYAYRVIKFPNEKKSYDISFDWKCQGDANHAQMFVYFGLEADLNSGLNLLQYASENLSGVMSVLSNSTAINSFSHPINSDGNSYLGMYGSAAWENVSFTVNVSASASTQNFILLFAWENTTLEESSNLSACVDNIQIASNVAKKPTNLLVEPQCDDSTLLVSWESTNEWFELQFKNVNDTQWRRQTHIQASGPLQQSIAVKVPQGIEGSYDVRVRCSNEAQTDTSAWVTKYNSIYWCPDNHCVNYLDLYADNVVCRYGRHTTFGNYIAGDTIGVMDFGEDARESRHTINWRKNTIDPRTLYSRDRYGNDVAPLKTIPDDAIATVRLGNWDAMMGQEDITYTFVVDSVDQAILLVRYAVVLQTPEPQGYPGFMLIVYDENGNLIDQDCGVARFRYDETLEAEWNSSYVDLNGVMQSDRQFVWKDWTTLGYNMAPYHGRQIQVKLETFDCTGGAHAAYAYFILDCVSGRLKSDNCGADEIMRIEAPIGFNYTWTDSKGEEVGYEQVLEVPASHEVYHCQVCMLEDPNNPLTATNCCFNLSTEMAPQYAYPDFEYQWVTENCESKIQLQDKSHIVMRDAQSGFEQHTPKACDNVEWEIHLQSDPMVRIMQEANPIITCNPNGDIVYIRQVATIGICGEVREDTIVVGSIYSQPAIFNDTICQKDLPRIFHGEKYETAGTWNINLTNFAGCDSVLTYNLVVLPNSEPVEVSQTICSSGLPFWFNGFSYAHQGTYQVTLTNQLGCDSIVNLNLSVVDKVEIELDTTQITLCADDEYFTIDFSIIDGTFDSLLVSFNDAAHRAGFEDRIIKDNTLNRVEYSYSSTVLPGVYEMRFEFFQPASCGNQVFTLPFVINYSSDLLVQRWNDVLGILSTDYNGGYDFSSYQWYKNGQQIDGQTNPYLYQEGGLDLSAQYTVKVKRTDDGVELFICPITPQYFGEQDNIPTLLHEKEHIKMNSQGRARWTSLAGIVLYEQTFTPQTGIEVPALPIGYYLLTIMTDNAIVTQRVLVTQ